MTQERPQPIIHGGMPHHREGILKFLGCEESREGVAEFTAEQAGPLPPGLQTYTVYEAAVPSNAPSPTEAKAFFDRLIGRPARARFDARGFEAVK